METKNLTVVFTDMKGFTNRTFLTSRREIAILLSIQDEIIRTSVKKFSGRVVKTMGDGYLIVFDSPTNAVLSAVDIQNKVNRRNHIPRQSLKFEMRIGINSGEVELKKGDIFGDAVNIASRLQNIAVPGSVYLTEPVYLTMNKNEIPVDFIGQKKVKGIPQKVKIYKVVNDEGVSRKTLPIAAALYAFSAVLLVLFYFVYSPKPQVMSSRSLGSRVPAIDISVESGYVEDGIEILSLDVSPIPSPQSISESSSPTPTPQAKSKGKGKELR